MSSSRGGSTSNQLLVAQFVDNDSEPVVVYSNNVVKMEQRPCSMGYYCAGLIVMLGLIFGLTIGLGISSHNNNNNNDNQNSMCNDVTMKELSVGEICRCHDDASSLLLTPKEKELYESFTTILLQAELIHHRYSRDSCELENQALRSLANQRVLFEEMADKDDDDDDNSSISISSSSSSSIIDAMLDPTTRATVSVRLAHEAVIQQFILTLFFFATNGHNWNKKEGFTTTTTTTRDAINTCCAWTGISCSTLGRIQEIRLANNGLDGSIPWQLWRMPFLKALDLSHNPNLVGTLFTTAGSTTTTSSSSSSSSLHSLEIASCGLEGSVPMDLLANVEGLTKIDLSNNNLNGTLPSEIGNLGRLREVWLDGNSLSGSIPSEIGSISNLEVLSLRENLLTGTIPFQLSRLEFLETLHLGTNNELSGTIPHMALPRLTAMTISDTKLVGSIPESFCVGNSNLLIVTNCKKNEKEKGEGSFVLDRNCSCCETVSVCVEQLPIPKQGEL